VSSQARVLVAQPPTSKKRAATAEAVKSALASARDGREVRLREAVEGGALIERAVSTREQRFAERDAADEEATARRMLASCKESAEAASEAEQWAQGGGRCSSRAFRQGRAAHCNRLKACASSSTASMRS